MSPASATWCTQCYLPFQASAPQPAFAGVAPAAYPAPAQGSWSGASPPSLAYQPWPAPAPTAAEPAQELAGPAGGRLLDRRALVLVAIAIGLGAVMQVVAITLSHRPSISNSTLVRYSLVLTLLLYTMVAVMIVSQITPSVRLRWGEGPALERIGLGLLYGAGLAAVSLGLASLAAGHLNPDSRIVLLMSERDPSHVIITFALTCIAAPLIEETLFRGLLFESMRPHGTAVAVLVSAGAFAVWHLNRAALLYYFAVGCALAAIYLSRGLAASIATHLAFNTVLTIAAVVVVFGPSHLVTVDGISLTSPGGWSQVSSVNENPLGAAVELRGPDDAAVSVLAGPVGRTFDPDLAAQQLATSSLPLPAGSTVDQTTVT